MLWPFLQINKSSYNFTYVDMTRAKPEWFQLSYQIESAESEFQSEPSHLSPVNDSENYGYILF